MITSSTAYLLPKTEFLAQPAPPPETDELKQARTESSHYQEDMKATMARLQDLRAHLEKKMQEIIPRDPPPAIPTLILSKPRTETAIEWFAQLNLEGREAIEIEQLRQMCAESDQYLEEMQAIIARVQAAREQFQARFQVVRESWGNSETVLKADQTIKSSHFMENVL